ncbi:MAG: MGMT family protein [Acidobacteria bacterium]|nr:MGMT family protein [Acidobacteriota bacterium]
MTRPAPEPDQSFREAVLAVVADIPKGRLTTYGQVALLAGFPGRARQVGWVLSGLPSGTRLPWHRVVNAAGYIPSKGREISAVEQIRRLRKERIEVDDRGTIRDLGSHLWRPE